MIELEPFGEEVGEKEDLMRATQAIYANLERETKRQIVTKRERARAHTEHRRVLPLPGAPRVLSIPHLGYLMRATQAVCAKRERPGTFALQPRP